MSKRLNFTSITHHNGQIQVQPNKLHDHTYHSIRSRNITLRSQGEKNFQIVLIKCLKYIHPLIGMIFQAPHFKPHKTHQTIHTIRLSFVK